MCRFGARASASAWASVSAAVEAVCRHRPVAFASARRSSSSGSRRAGPERGHRDGAVAEARGGRDGRHRVCELVAVCGEVVAGVDELPNTSARDSTTSGPVVCAVPIAAVARLPAALAAEPRCVEPRPGRRGRGLPAALVEPLETVKSRGWRTRPGSCLPLTRAPLEPQPAATTSRGKTASAGRTVRDRSGVLFWA